MLPPPGSERLGLREGAEPFQREPWEQSEVAALWTGVGLSASRPGCGHRGISLCVLWTVHWRKLQIAKPSSFPVKSAQLVPLAVTASQKACCHLNSCHPVSRFMFSVTHTQRFWSPLCDRQRGMEDGSKKEGGLQSLVAPQDGQVTRKAVFSGRLAPGIIQHVLEL